MEQNPGFIEGLKVPDYQNEKRIYSIVTFK